MTQIARKMKKKKGREKNKREKQKEKKNATIQIMNHKTTMQ